MTDQTPNGLHYNGEGYAVMDAEPGVFSPWDYGIEPESICSSNWSGYTTLYEVRDGVLHLNYLTVGHTPRRGPPPKEDPDDPLSMIQAGSPPLPLLNGVKAQKGSMGYWDYHDIDLRLDYTGTLTIGNDTNPHAPYYLELVFEHGRLISSKDIEPPPSADIFEL